jgi:hypothetical protein
MIHRRMFLHGMSGLAIAPFGFDPQLAQAAPAPLAEAHFPDRLHLFVWRNWELANSDRMADVVGCRPEDILAIGSSLGLPRKPRLTADQLRRISITIIRQNWHLLPDEQLIRLLGWTDERLRFTLKEDDFLDIKLGPKPECPRLIYAPPDEPARRRAAEIKRQVLDSLGRELEVEGEPAFAFIPRLSDMSIAPRRDPASRPSADQVDLSGWAVQGDEGVDRRVVDRLTEYLQAAMKAGPGRDGARAVRLHLDPQLGERGEHFRVTVDDGRVEVTGNSAGGLLQGISWVQDRMEEHGGPFLTRGRVERQAAFHPRYLYSYFALYGDPLLEPDIDPFPDGLLEKLARAGVNGVWLQAVLNTLAPSATFPEFGTGSDRRLATLSGLVERARRFGIRVFLYLNEPRSMPAAFFEGREEMRGAEFGGYHAMCTTHPAVREWIAASLAHVFERVPGLGGVFSITMSENLTNCYSKGRPDSCPRCSQRQNWGEGVEEVLRSIHDGVRRSSAEAEVIAWDWGWRDDQARYLIPRLTRDSRFQSVSEWSIPIERGGVKTRVGEYSISVVGPGPRATANWKLAEQAGVPTLAKVQLNNSWEISAVPYVPAAYLVARHCANLAAAGIGGLMQSWTLGGYPSPNLEIAREVCFAPEDGVDQILRRVARRRYGDKAAPLVLDAWKGFSDAFEQYPYGVHIYLIPTQHGPANLLRVRPSGAATGMILFPQDAYRAWSGAYPPEVVRDQFTRMADLWEKALPLFRRAVERVPATRKSAAEEDLAIAETCLIHFRSVANQVAFYLLRDGKPTAESRARMRELAEREKELARRLYVLARQHAVIAYEASNHYYYRPLDLIEKVINCQYILDLEL